MTGRVLVAGVGNIFLGDDGFGVEVARRLSRVETPPDVRIADFGIRGVHLAYELLDGYDTLVLVDAMSRGEPPGTVSVVELAAALAGLKPRPKRSLVFLTFFMLLEGPAWMDRFYRLLPEGKQPRVQKIGHDVYRTVGGSMAPSVRKARGQLSSPPICKLLRPIWRHVESST